MFERFTDTARRATVMAQEDARSLNHNYIGTEHILCGLLAVEDTLAASALRDLGYSHEKVLTAVEEIIGRGKQSPTGHIPFTPRAKKVLELSLREALQLGHNYIGCEHIVLGLVREGEGVGAGVLVRDHSLKDIREAVISRLMIERPPAKSVEDSSVRSAYMLLREFLEKCYPDDMMGNGELISTVDSAIAAVELLYAAVPKDFEGDL